MAWPWRRDIWQEHLSYIQADIAHLAAAVTAYEQVIMLVPKQKSLRPRTHWQKGIHFLPFDYDDIWVRDTAPIWLSDGTAINPRFNGWGGKKLGRKVIPHASDATLASRLCEMFGVLLRDLGLVLEGGAVESDGKGQILLTKSNMLSESRNGSISTAEIEAIFKEHFDTRVIWLPGASSDYDFTDGHVDAIARCTPSGQVLYDELDEIDAYAAGSEYISVQKNADVLVGGTALRRPRGLYATAYECYSYANFYITENAVIIPSFYKDNLIEKRVYEAVRKAYGREVIPISLPTLFGNSGGGIHCVLREVPAWLKLL